MGDRKVLNYYISHDFDPSILPKMARDRTKPIEVRTMLAFSIQCNTCGEYMYRGKKFNSKCERLENETYLGIKKFRFYIKCSVCSAQIVFKTDPENCDYEMESGATRNFELWRDTQQSIQEVEKQREDEEKNDSMKALENRTLDSKVEMDVLDALDEIKSINKRHEKVDTNALLSSIGSSSSSSTAAADRDGLTAEDEALIKSISFKKKRKASSVADVEEVDEEETTGVSEPSAADAMSSSTNRSNSNGVSKPAKAAGIAGVVQAAKPNTASAVGLGAVGLIVKKKKIANDAAPTAAAAAESGSKTKDPAQVSAGTSTAAAVACSGAAVSVSATKSPAASLFGDYGSSSEDEN